MDALCGFYVTGGGFRHLMADKTVDGMATEQGYYALAAYYRLLAQKTSLYDMSDVTVTVTPDQPVTPASPKSLIPPAPETRACWCCGWCCRPVRRRCAADAEKEKAGINPASDPRNPKGNTPAQGRCHNVPARGALIGGVFR